MPTALEMPMTQRAGGGFHAASVAVLRMTGGLGAELTELLQILDRQAVAEQMQKGIQQHGAVAGGEHEAVAIRPLVVGGIMLHFASPYGICHRRSAHGHARVAALGLLYRFRGQDANRVDNHGFLVHHRSLPFLIWSSVD